VQPVPSPRATPLQACVFSPHRQGRWPYGGRDRDSQQGTMKPHRHSEPHLISGARVATCIWAAASLSLGVATGICKPRPPTPPIPCIGLAHTEHFDQPLQMPSDQVIDPSVWAESWSGYCLDRSSSTVVPWAIPMAGTDRTWVDPASGAIRFWYRPGYDSGAGPGHIATLLFVIKTNALFSDDFRRCTGALAPWKVQSGSWALGGGTLEGSNPPNSYAYCYFDTNWTSYSVEASLQFPGGGFGGGLGGRLNPANGAHYAAWIYPEGGGGTNVLKLIKFLTWETWGTNGTNNHVPMASTNLAVGTGWHPVKLVFNGNQIDVYYDGARVINTTDAEPQPYSSGGLTLDMWIDATTYSMSVSNLVSY
jgi:hypothetical protein